MITKLQHTFNALLEQPDVSSEHPAPEPATARQALAKPANATLEPAADESELVARLQQYQTLQRAEREQRELVRILSRQIAHYGPLLAPAYLRRELHQQRVILAVLRADLADLERELAKEQQAYDTAKAANAAQAQLQIHEHQIERLQSDIENKWEQIEIQKANIRALEQLQAKYGLGTPVHVINALQIAQADLQQLSTDLNKLELELRDVYGIEYENAPEPTLKAAVWPAIKASASARSPEHSPIALTARLQQHRALQRDEHELSELVHLLERQVARYGPLMAPARLQHTLNEQRATLERLRAELAALERDLEQEQHAYDAAKAADAAAPQLQIHEQKIERLQRDIDHKQEQIQLHEANVRALEQLQASYGPQTPVYVSAELNILLKRIAWLREEIRAAELVLYQEYGLPQNVLRELRRQHTQAYAATTAANDAPELGTKLDQYRALRHAERERRALVRLLARQVAQYGPLMAPAHIQHELREQRAMLAQLRTELATLERELEQEQQAHAAAKSADAGEAQLLVHEQKIERIQNDIDAKLEQLQLHKTNMHMLEQLQAKYNLDTPVHVINVLQLISAEINQLNADLNTLELELRLVYGLHDIGERASTKKSLLDASEPAIHNTSADQEPIVLAARLQRYQALERQQRDLVYQLENQVAQYGTLLAPAELQVELDKQRATLAGLRAELATLEHKFEQEQQAYDEAKATDADEAQLQIHEQKIERLQRDIDHKQEQIQIHEANLRALELTQASYGLDTPLHVINERNVLLQQITWLRADIQAAELELHQGYGLSLEVLRELRSAEAPGDPKNN
jgi:hypothetical protein